MEKKMVEVTLVNYFDVWGNPEDGFEVNNLCTEGTMELPEGFSNKELLAGLIDFGFLKPTVTEEMVTFEDLHDFGVEFYQADNGCPIGRVECRE